MTQEKLYEKFKKFKSYIHSVGQEHHLKPN